MKTPPACISSRCSCTIVRNEIGMRRRWSEACFEGGGSWPWWKWMFVKTAFLCVKQIQQLIWLMKQSKFTDKVTCLKESKSLFGQVYYTSAYVWPVLSFVKMAKKTIHAALSMWYTGTWWTLHTSCAWLVCVPGGTCAVGHPEHSISQTCRKSYLIGASRAHLLVAVSFKSDGIYFL